MTTRLLLSTIVLTSTISSAALAEQKLVAAPASKADATVRDVAPPKGAPNDPSSDRATYFSVSLTTIPEASLEPVFVNAELGRQLGEKAAYLHLQGGRVLGLWAFGISMYQARIGVEGRGGTSTVRGFGGLDVGAWMAFAGSESATAFVTVPRLGIEVGNRVWFRGTLEIPISMESSDDVVGPVMLSVGVGAEL